MQYALLTDLYEITMAKSYFDAGIASNTATFEVSFRRCPFQGEYAVLSGHDAVRDILENFKFDNEAIDYLKCLSQFEQTSDDFFKHLQSLRFDDIEVRALPEGALAFARVPLFEILGPLLKVQLLESALLNAINFSTLVATYARRLHQVAEGRHLMEFGLRRAQGPNGALTASRASYLGGVTATSNVLAGKTWSIPVVGTMAHSFIQSFSLESSGAGTSTPHPGELAAFLRFAQSFPKNCVLLVDTYDTLLSGIPNAITTFRWLKTQGYEPKGVRLDSGDLVFLSREARRSLDAAGFNDAKIYASNELDEGVIASLQKQGAAIDVYAVGTKLVTAAEDPALGGVYKLVELDGKPRMKISNQTEKLTLPGRKNAYRFFGRNDEALLDFITLFEEAPPGGNSEIMALHPLEPYKRVLIKPQRCEPLMKPLWMSGRWLETRSLAQRRADSLESMKSLRDDIKRRENPSPYKVSLSKAMKEQFSVMMAQEMPVKSLS